MRREDLTSDEAAAAMAEVMDGRAAPTRRSPGLLIGLAMKGERPTEIVGLARTMRAHAVKISDCRAPVFDTLRHGRRSIRHVQYLVVRSRWSSPRAACAWPSTATDRCRACPEARTCSRRSA